MLLSVGRLVVKKGYEDLLTALALLPPDLKWRFVHIGGGALGNALMHQAARLGLSHKIEWRGALAQPDVLASYRQADLFVLASKVAKDGDRDGLPNVIQEALALGTPVVTTDVTGIPEVVRDGETGLQVPQRDPQALAEALDRLLTDPRLRVHLATGARRLIEAEFDIRRNAERRRAIFRAARQPRPVPHEVG